MGTLIARRLLTFVPILLIVSFFVFLLIALVPGDAAVTLAGGSNAPKGRIAEVRHQLHLDDPFPEQYGRWLSNAVQGDLGSSLYSRGAVIDAIGERFPVTLSLVLATFVLTLLIGIPSGILSALRPGDRADKGSRIATSIGLSIPDYWLAIELVVLFAVTWRLLPAVGYTPFFENPLEWLRGITLPAVALAIPIGARLSRQLRAALIDVLDTNYIRTAWAKGGNTRLIVLKHGLKNAAIPAVTLLGVEIGYLIGGTVIIEQIFSIPGMGTYFINAVPSRDVPVIQGCVLVFALAAMTMSLVADLAYGLLNPKVRVQ